MSLDRTVAHFVTHRRRLAVLVTVLIAVVATLIIVFKIRFASDILDLLPRHFDSVQAFKTFDREFAQAREITFGIHDESGETDLDAFIEHFSSALRAEPWVVRIMDRSPAETAPGDEGVQFIAVPLLLNLPPEDFEPALAALDPANLATRFQRLRAELEAGSQKAEFQLEFDPLGLVALALKPLDGSLSVEQMHPLSSPDGTLRLVFAVTNQADLGARACQEMMAKVEALKQRVLATWEGPKPEILVTGRTAYVGELSLVMRRDIVSTIPGSLLFVMLVFWIGFRRLRPLFSLIHVLLLACLISVAVGALLFRELNMITIGLCSILIGVGEDFGMMLYGIYQSERDAGHDHETAISAAIRHHGSAIAFGALTTAAAFLCLLLSETAAYAQLGVLIAVGVILSGVLTCTVFFLFIGKKHRPRPRSRIRAGSEFFVRHAFTRTLWLLVPSTLLLGGLCLYALAPIGRINFEADPKSLEPRNSRAGIALRTITSKMTGVSEPIIAIVKAADAETFHQHWNTLNTAWTELVRQGKLKTVNSPAAFALSPRRLMANSARLAGVDFTKTREALTASLTAEGLNVESFRSAFAFIDTLERAARGDHSDLNWRRNLAPDSAWLFVIDRFFGNAPNLGAAYVQPVKKIASVEEKNSLRELLAIPDIDVHLSGWSYALYDLVPWAKSKLIELTGAMLVLNVIILLILCRRVFPVALLMLSLALSVGAMVATLKLLGVSLNLFNVLAFPLVLGVGVDYGIYIVEAMRTADPRRELVVIAKPVLLSGLTTVVGFGSLMTATNPSLSGLGIVCACGVAWCLFSTFFFVLPICIWRGAR